MKALILAGGLGTRLRPLTFAIPKALIPVRETPIIELIIRHLKKFGFKTIYVSTNYKSEILKLFLGDGSKWGVEIRCIDEEKRMGTAGPIGLVEIPDDEDLLVMNGDILTTLNIRRMLAYHRKKKADFTVGTVQISHQSRFGEINVNADNEVVNIKEKPISTVTISAGIYICNMKNSKFIPRGRHLDMPELMIRLIKRGRKVMNYPITEKWNAIEKLSDYTKLHTTD